MEHENQIHDQNKSRLRARPGKDSKPRQKPRSTEVKLTTQGTVFPFVAQTVSDLAIADNLNRNYLIVQNNGAANIFINFNAAASINHIKIIPGGNYEPIVVPTGGLHIISSAANNDVAILEGIK